LLFGQFFFAFFNQPIAALAHRTDDIVAARFRYRGVLIHSCFEIHNDRRLTQKQVTSVHKEFSGGPRQRHSDFIPHWNQIKQQT
jgi:hypothetical protein